jgi:hypothetical protein
MMSALWIDLFFCLIAPQLCNYECRRQQEKKKPREDYKRGEREVLKGWAHERHFVTGHFFWYKQTRGVAPVRRTNGRNFFVPVQCYCELLDGRRDPQITYSLCAYKCVEVHTKIWYENPKEKSLARTRRRWNENILNLWFSWWWLCHLGFNAV